MSELLHAFRQYTLSVSDALKEKRNLSSSKRGYAKDVPRVVRRGVGTFGKRLLSAPIYVGDTTASAHQQNHYLTISYLFTVLSSESKIDNSCDDSNTWGSFFISCSGYRTSNNTVPSPPAKMEADIAGGKSAARNIWGFPLATFRGLTHYIYDERVHTQISTIRISLWLTYRPTGTKSSVRPTDARV